MKTTVVVTTQPAPVVVGQPGYTTQPYNPGQPNPGQPYPEQPMYPPQPMNNGPQPDYTAPPPSFNQ